MEKRASRSMSTEPLNFDKVTSVKLPGSVGYVYSNLVSYTDILNNISYYAIINGFEVWIIKHFEPEKLRKSECKHIKEPNIELRKVPFDKSESITAVKWCKFNNNSMTAFVVCTDFGKIHIYDLEGKKSLHSHDINNTNTNNNNMTVNCIESNNGNLLFIGLSCGALLSFNLNDNGLSNKKLLFQCTDNEGINCISKPVTTKNKENNNNKIYIGCDDGSVIQYDFYSSDIDILIDKSNANKIMSDDNNDNNNSYNNCGSCICISSCDDFVVAGYSSGFIKIVQKSELSFVIKQIAMHRRMVTSVDILQECLIATVSEDGYFHILRNTTSSLDVIRSGFFQNSMLIGCKFIKTNININHYPLYHQKSKDKILLIAAYDRNKLAFV